MQSGNILPFRVHALLDTYKQTYDDMEKFLRAVVSEDKAHRTLSDIESTILNKYGKSTEPLARMIDAGTYYWGCTTTITGTVKTAQHQFRPRYCQKSNAFYRKYGRDRFLHVEIVGLRDWRDHQEFFGNGIHFGGGIFEFFGGVLKDKNSEEGFSHNSSGEKQRLFVAWFFRVDLDSSNSFHPRYPTFQSDLGTSGPREVSVPEARGWLGDFSDTRKYPALKINARISLGFSPSISSSFELPTGRIFVVDDVSSSVDGSGRIMTDGCGFIADDIACQILYGISSGRIRRLIHDYSSASTDGIVSRPCDAWLPSVLQVRLVCSHGLFKGCLIVTPVGFECSPGFKVAPGSVVMRKSMMKAKCHPDFGEDAPVVPLDIVSTFELSDEKLSHYSREVFADLNRSAVLLLSHLGVPLACFERRLRDEVDRQMAVVRPTKTPEAILKTIQRIVRQSRLQKVVSMPTAISLEAVEPCLSGMERAVTGDDEADDLDDRDSDDETTVKDDDLMAGSSTSSSQTRIISSAEILDNCGIRNDSNPAAAFSAQVGPDSVSISGTKRARAATTETSSHAPSDFAIRSGGLALGDAKCADGTSGISGSGGVSVRGSGRTRGVNALVDGSLNGASLGDWGTGKTAPVIAYSSSSSSSSNSSSSKGYGIKPAQDVDAYEDPPPEVKIFRFLSAGHSTDEPRLLQLLCDLQMQSLRRLGELRLRLPDSVYVVGVPDPCGVLEEGQVCVMLYKSSKPVGVAGVAGASDLRLAEGPTSRAAAEGGGGGAGLPHYGGSNQAKFAERQRRVEGDVVILRNPILHPGDVRKLRAVHPPALEDFSSRCCGGLVIFSTKGRRSPADEMGGGDFDGDTFFVIFGDSNRDIISAVQPIAPLDYADLAQSVGDEIRRAASRVSATSPVRRTSSAAAAGGHNTPSRVQGTSVAYGSGAGGGAGGGAYAGYSDACGGEQGGVGAEVDRLGAMGGVDKQAPMVSAKKSRSIAFGGEGCPDLAGSQTALFAASKLPKYDTGRSSKAVPLCSSNTAYKHQSMMPFEGSPAPVPAPAPPTDPAEQTKVKVLPEATLRRLAEKKRKAMEIREKKAKEFRQKDMSAAEIAREDEEERIRKLKASEERRRQEEQELLRRLAEAKAKARADSADIYRGLLKSASSFVVGSYSIAWQNISDHEDYGPCSEPALRCLLIVCTALDAAKSGESVREDPSLLRLLPPPHYLRKDDQQDKKAYRISKSVVGQLFDLIGAAMEEVKCLKEMRRRPESIVDRDLILEPIYMDDFLAPKWRKKWKDNFLKCKASIGDIMRQASMNRSSQFKELYSLYRREFVRDSETMYQDLFAPRPVHQAATEGSVARGSTAATTAALPVSFSRSSLGGHNRVSSGGASVGGSPSGLSRFVKKFEMQQKAICRQYLASLVYVEVYLDNDWCKSGQRSEADKSPSVTFFWEVCSQELHSIKRESYKQRYGREPLEDIILR